MNEDDAKVRFDAGADLVQIYTGLIYRGPGLVRKIANQASGARSQNDRRCANLLNPDS